jgi:acetyltransferase-like isoleucine patch superfamily enzyme
LTDPARRALRNLEQEAWNWRNEPIRRVAVMNKALRPLRVRQFAHFGKGSILHRPQWLYGTHHISIGDQAIILHGVWLAAERLSWERAEPTLLIGDRVGMRPGCTISAAESIVLERNVGLAGGATVIDSKHAWGPHSTNVLDGSIQSAPIRIGEGTWVGEKATIAAGADIGTMCAIGPNAVVTTAVPDYSIVVGNPGRVVGSTRT